MLEYGPSTLAIAAPSSLHGWVFEIVDREHVPIPARTSREQRRSGKLKLKHNNLFRIHARKIERKERSCNLDGKPKKQSLLLRHATRPATGIGRQETHARSLVKLQNSLRDSCVKPTKIINMHLGNPRHFCAFYVTASFGTEDATLKTTTNLRCK